MPCTSGRYAPFRSPNAFLGALTRLWIFGSPRHVRARIGVEKTGEKTGELLEFVGGEGAHGRGRAQQDGIGGRDGLVPGVRERDQLAAPVIGVRTAFDQTVGFQFVDDQGRIGSVDTVGLRELTQRRRPAAELEQDLPPAAAEAEPERLGEFGVAVMGLDEPLHEGPGLLDGIG